MNNAKQILEDGDITGEIFEEPGEFIVTFHGLAASGQDWFLECLPKGIPTTSDQWVTLHEDEFTNDEGKSFGIFRGSSNYWFRVRNKTTGSPANSGITAYKAAVEVYRAI